MGQAKKHFLRRKEARVQNSLARPQVSMAIDIDLVIEARDARLPLTSINPAFDEVLEESWGRMNLAGPSGWKGKGKEKVVVYTKRDQAEERFEEVSSGCSEEIDARNRIDPSLSTSFLSLLASH